MVRKETIDLETTECILVIPNIRSAHNVGSLFRTADGAGFSKVYLCGYSPTPVDKFGRISGAQKEIAKTALGAELAIPYVYTKTLKSAITALKKEGCIIMGLEQDKMSLKLAKTKDRVKLKEIVSSNRKIALVMGEEVSGLTAADKKLLDYMIELPMYGTKESLNVSVAGGIAMYMLRML